MSAHRLSAAQLGVWTAQRLDDTGRRFVIAGYAEIGGPVDEAVLGRAWRQLAEECGVLRLRAIAPDGTWVSAPAGEADGVALVDLTAAADPRSAAAEWMRTDLRRPTDLDRGPLSAAALLRLAPDLHFFYQRYHHSVADATTYSMVFGRLGELYSAFAAGQSPTEGRFEPFPTLAEADAAYRAGEQYARDAAYWTGHFADQPLPSRLAVRTESPAGADAFPQRVSCTGELAPEVVRALRDLAREQRSGWPAVVTAITAAYLARMTAREEVVLGLPVAARTSPAERRTPGMASSTVPLRITVPAGASLADLLAGVGEEFSAALRHQRFRHEDLTRALGLVGDRFGLVGAMVNFLPALPATTWAGHPVTVHSLSAGPAADLTFGVGSPTADGVLVACDANPDYFTEEEVRAHRDRFLRFAEAAAARPTLAVGRLPLLSEQEQRVVLEDWNGTVREPGIAFVARTVAQRAAEHPDDLALVSESATLTYAQLNRQADELAAELAARGVGPEDRVAIMMPRSAELVVAMLAVLRAGAAYVPVDPEYPEQRRDLLIADSRPACVIDRTGAVTGHGGGAAGHGLLPGHPAYVTYTSGSTGRPKGVVVAHGGLANLVDDHVIRFGFERGSRALQFVSPSFDAAAADIWPALASGACLVLAPVGRTLSGTYLHDFLREQRITHAALPPVVVATLPDVPLPELRVLVVGGSDCAPEVAERWSAGRRMFNAYGPTEATVTASCSAPLAGPVKPSIGMPVQNARLFVLDDELQPVPAWVPGELYVAGVGLARGYLDRPGATAEKFLPCPFGPDGARMYRTGDLARRRADGTLEYLGRADGQIKLRGFRIEPGEIESVLARDESVANALVVAAAGGTRLQAYVVPAHGATVDTAALRRRAARSLPDYMVPAAIMVLDAFPLTPNGKVDRAALPEPDFARPGAADAEPATEAEAALCAAFAKVLGVPRFGVDESFFDHGGDSILALQVVSLAREAGVGLSLADVFRHQTPRELAAVAQAEEAPTEPVAEPYGPVATTPAFAWFGEATGWKHGVPGFNQSVVVRVPRGADPVSLRAALQAVVDRHDALRAVLVHGDGGTPHLEVPEPGRYDVTDCLTTVDGPATPQALDEQTVRARELLAPWLGRMLRAVWFDAGREQDGSLLLMAHHLVVDGVSWRVLLADLATAWEAVSAGRRPELPPVRTSLRDWAHRVNAAADVTAQEADHWREVLRTPDPRIAERDLDPAVDLAGRARHLEVELPADATRRLLVSIPAAFRAGPEDVLLTGFSLALGGWRELRGGPSGNEVLIDLEGHGREQLLPSTDLSRTVGWFTAIHPVRLDPGPGTDLARALKRVKEQLRALPARGTGFGPAKYLAGAFPDAPTPRVGFNYLGRFAMDAGGPWSLEPDPRTPGSGADPAMPFVHEIEVNSIAHEDADGLRLRTVFSWPEGLFGEDDVRALADAWLAWLGRLAAAAEDPGFGGRTPSDFPLVALDADRLERLERERPDLTDIWPLTPLQQGLLTQTLLDEDGDDAYVARLTLDLEGPLDAPRLRRAAERLVERHPALRVAFDCLDGAEPLQVVCASAVPGWRLVDLSGYDQAGRAAALAELEAELERVRFDLADPPLLSLVVARLDADHHRVHLLNHHLLWDGWSTPVLLTDLFALYEGRQTPEAARESSPVRYLGWLAGQDQDAAVRAWSAALAGPAEPTVVAPQAAGLSTVRHGQLRTELSAELTAELTELARTRGLTVNTLTQGAWAVVLGGIVGGEDVVFGTSVSGRPPELPGIARAVGMFTNTVPVRVRMDPAEPAVEMLTRLQREQTELLDHQFLGLAEIQRAARGRTLFDTTMVCLNYPLDPQALDAQLSEIRLTALDGHDGTHFPLRLVVIPGARLRLWLGYRPDVYGTDEAQDVLDRVVRVLEGLAADPQRSVDSLDQLPTAYGFVDLAQWGGYGNVVGSDD
jgi:amino acid adenylation domain-containing protein/non-ribosomal peptide synthase protein (TIGR01720 family)